MNYNNLSSNLTDLTVTHERDNAYQPRQQRPNRERDDNHRADETSDWRAYKTGDSGMSMGSGPRRGGDSYGIGGGSDFGGRRDNFGTREGGDFRRDNFGAREGGDFRRGYGAREGGERRTNNEDNLAWERPLMAPVTASTDVKPRRRFGGGFSSIVQDATKDKIVEPRTTPQADVPARSFGGSFKNDDRPRNYDRDGRFPNNNRDARDVDFNREGLARSGPSQHKEQDGSTVIRLGEGNGADTMRRGAPQSGMTARPKTQYNLGSTSSWGQSRRETDDVPMMKPKPTVSAYQSSIKEEVAWNREKIDKISSVIQQTQAEKKEEAKVAPFPAPAVDKDALPTAALSGFAAKRAARQAEVNSQAQAEEEARQKKIREAEEAAAAKKAEEERVKLAKQAKIDLVSGNLANANAEQLSALNDIVAAGFESGSVEQFANFYNADEEIKKSTVGLALAFAHYMRPGIVAAEVATAPITEKTIPEAKMDAICESIQAAVVPGTDMIVKFVEEFFKVFQIPTFAADTPLDDVENVRKLIIIQELCRVLPTSGLTRVYRKFHFCVFVCETLCNAGIISKDDFVTFKNRDSWATDESSETRDRALAQLINFF